MQGNLIGMGNQVVYDHRGKHLSEFTPPTRSPWEPFSSPRAQRTCVLHSGNRTWLTPQGSVLPQRCTCIATLPSVRLWSNVTALPV